MNFLYFKLSFQYSYFKFLLRAHSSSANFLFYKKISANTSGRDQTLLCSDQLSVELFENRRKFIVRCFDELKYRLKPCSTRSLILRIVCVSMRQTKCVSNKILSRGQIRQRILDHFSGRSNFERSLCW